MAGDTIHNSKPEAQAVAEIVKGAFEPRLMTVDGVQFFVGPAGVPTSIKKLVDEHAEQPDRREGTANLHALESLVAWTNRFKNPNSAIFASARGDGGDPSIEAIIDYHHAGPDGEPRFGRHRGVYRCPLSDEWKAWKATVGRSFSQADFAAFIEDRILDVLDPEQAGSMAGDMMRALACQLAPPARLMELSRGLQVNVGSMVRNAKNLSSGESQVVFQEEHRDAAGAPLQIPGAFLIGIPVFRSGDLYQIPVRLRYRVKDGAISWSLDLYRADRIFDSAFDDAVTRASEATGLPVFRGSSEK